MECSCSIGVGVGGCCTVLSAKLVTSKAARKCTECGKQIKPSSKYYREKILHDGRLSIYKTCQDCISIRDNLCRDWIYGFVLEVVTNAIDAGLEIPEKCIAKLTPAARAWVCELIEKEWKRMSDE